MSKLPEPVYKRLVAWILVAVLSIGLCADGIWAQEDTPAEEAAAETGKTVVPPPSSDSELSQSGPIVQEISVEYVGPRTVAQEVILSNMRTTIGQPYTEAAVEEDVRNLYATGFFVNLRIYDEKVAGGVKVIVIVQPKATVKEIVVQGADKIEEEDVRKKLKTKVGDPLSKQTVAGDVQELRKFYIDKGYQNATIEYKIDVNEPIGRAVVTYIVNEGEVRWVREIKFEGAKAFDEEQLQKAIKTKVRDWLAWLNKTGRLNEGQLEEDKRMLREFYFDNGYIDMQIRDVRIEDFDEDGMRITFNVFEGIQYKVGKIYIEGNTLFTTEELRGKMKMLEDTVFSPKGLQEDVKAIVDVYGEKGYIESKANPRREPNIESGRMDLTYAIKEGPQFFVEKVVIQGNNQTKDKVIRREVALAPGDVYDTVSAEASKKRLENLNYFERVEVNEQETRIPGRKNMVITVEEKRTGSVSFGVGFSTVDSVVGFVELQQGNFDIQNPPSFVGGGQKFRTRVQYGLRRRDFIVSLTEPWFLNQRLSLGGDLFYNESDYLSSLYSQRRYGGAIRIARALNQFWTIGLRYQLENIELFEVDNEASQAIRQEAGTRSKSSVLATVTYDTRDNIFLTRSGEKVEFGAEGAGGPLLGDTKIWKLTAEATKFFSLPYDLILSVGGTTGVTDAWDDAPRVPLYDRFFVGGSRSIRGFDFREVGPRDNGGEPLGGLTMGYTNTELTFPIIKQVRGAVFFDAGFNNSGVFDYSLANIEAGTGFGLRLDLPIGPLRLDIGFPIIYEPLNDSDFKFHFDVGYQF